MQKRLRRRRSPWFYAPALAVALGIVVAGGLAGGAATAAAPESSVKSPVGTPRIVDIAKHSNPAVVNVSTQRKIQPMSRGEYPGFPFSPFQDFRAPQPPPEIQGSGSGFIIDPGGRVLTNHHVVDQGGDITVTVDTGSGEREYPARLIGSDPQTDIAVIQIIGGEGREPGPFPYLKMGDSAGMQVGEWVVAIGNPFGLNHTVTTGIVSAKGRSIGGPYDDFIQTDASINPGNSGGPLLNMQGEVVGMNTAILSRSGGNVGIGFAIPSNLVNDIVQQLEENGEVTRGWLGVQIQRLTPKLAQSLGLDTPEGALVNSVEPDGPADRGGLKRGDVIVRFDNRNLISMAELPRWVAGAPPGAEVRLDVIRDGQRRTLTVTLGDLATTPNQA
ncbi:MAG: S1C family serine protease [Nitrospinaceae bacterium]